MSVMLLRREIARLYQEAEQCKWTNRALYLELRRRLLNLQAKLWMMTREK